MNINKRLYNDFFRPSKEGDYEQILRCARDNEYEFHTVLSFEDVIANGNKDDKKCIILRRDIDTADFKILRKMLALENKYGARATYYFRWNTLDLSLIHEIAEAGGEASYHYEEIATFCYLNHIKNKEQVLQHIEEIRDLFINQYTKFIKVTGQPCKTIASHGDFINTKMGIPNKSLIDERVRKSCGFIREAYDYDHMKHITCRIADQNEMDLFTRKALAAIERGEPIIELLTHPRQWNSPIGVNLKEELYRIRKEVFWRFGI